MKKHSSVHNADSFVDSVKPSQLPSQPSRLSNILVKVLVFCVFVICFRFAYVITIRGESCDVGDFCFFSIPETLTISTTAGIPIAIQVRNDGVSVSMFEDLITEGFLSRKSKALVVVDTSSIGEEVMLLKELGVENAVGVSKKAKKPSVLGLRNGTLLPFNDNKFDFVFSSDNNGDELLRKLAKEIQRTIKPEGYLIVHIKSNDTYTLHSFISLFNDCTFIKIRDIVYGNDNTRREIVMKKEFYDNIDYNVNNNNKRNCEVVEGYKQDIVRKAENLIRVEPLKPWITLKRNIQNIKYLSDMVDISFKSRYVYVDVGARSYGSSIGSWFKKQYPKQNKTFDVYAIEADKSFYKEYELKKKRVTLLPYAAWVRNETLFFEVNHDPGDDAQEKGASGRGMGRIKPVQSGKDVGVDKINGFDFAEWLKSTVTEKDFVVMKMDVEGTEFDLIPRLIETGAICLIDEVFLECHYNRWQRCCPGERSAKYEKTYGQCLDLFSKLRARGVLVHQWW